MIADLIVIASDYWKTLSHPSPQTLIAISNNAHGRLTLSIIIALLLNEISLIGTLIIFKNSLGTIIRLVLGYLFAIPLLILLWAFFIYQICQNIFHHKKSDYESILYILALVTAVSVIFTYIGLPISLVSQVISDIVVWAGWVYMFALAVTGIYAITRLPVWQSILTVLVGAALAAFGGLILLVFSAAIMRTVPFIR